MLLEKMNLAAEFKTDWSAHFTESLSAAVPLAQMLGFKVEEMGPEKTICSLAGGEAGTNQNGTFQASTFYILADYAAGVALIAGLPEYSVFGVRYIPGAPLLQGWLKAGTVKHIRPATGRIHAIVEVSSSERARIRQELSESGKTTLAADVQIFQGIELVALAQHTVVFKTLPAQWRKAPAAS